MLYFILFLVGFVTIMSSNIPTYNMNRMYNLRRTQSLNIPKARDSTITKEYVTNHAENGVTGRKIEYMYSNGESDQIAERDYHNKRRSRNYSSIADSEQVK